MKLLLVGATGLVGRHVLALALADPRVTAVVAPTRRPLPEHPRLQAPLIDFSALPEGAGWWQADAVVCTLGTTMKKAGSRTAFRRVDYDYPLAVARIARRHGIPVYVLTSAIGADADARFYYNQVKGQLEEALKALHFASFTSVRPGVIGGPRAEFRMGERLLVHVLRMLSFTLPKRWQPNPPARIARALLEAALDPQPGFHVVSSGQLA